MSNNNNNNEPPPSISSTTLNPSQTLSSPLPTPSPSLPLPSASPSPNLFGIQERFESSAVRLTNFRIELPECGIRLHIEGTKEKNMTVQSALINVQGAAFWDSLLIRQSWPVRMAIKVARKNLPVQLCPHLMNPAAFIRGSTTFSTTIDLGTDGKGVNSKLTRERIRHKLNKLANVRGNPSLSFVVRLGGILGPVETAKMELERKNAKAAAAEKKKEKKDGEDDGDEAFDESLIGPLMFYFTTTPKQLVQSLNAKS